ncbi:MAG: hypothetical protein ABUT20_53415, partial [Bacteroidota bacterium]
KKKDAGPYAFLWLSLLLINLWAYTEIRLTATSASPDFIAALYILLAVYLCIEESTTTNENKSLIIFLCFFTFTVKLSALPLVLLSLYMLYPFTRIKTISFFALFCLVVIPFLVRNIITSGHLFFPSPLFDFVNADWKYDTKKLEHINKFILSYARTRGNTNSLQVMNTLPGVWLQKWWSYLFFADKLIIAVQFFSAGVLIFNYKNIIAENRLKKFCIALSLAGIIFWFVKAPDPRFGISFLLLFPSLVLSGKGSARNTARIFKPRLTIISLCLLTGLGTVFYTSYRFINYFRPAELIFPEGKIMPSTSVYYNEIKTSIPLINHASKNVTIVPATNAAIYFNFRGKTAEDGFSEKK